MTSRSASGTPAGRNRGGGQAKMVRPCRPEETQAIFGIINAAAEAYRGVIPDDCWHEPYMSQEALHAEISAGVVFLGCEVDNRLVGVMGMQLVNDVNLIRHAYVLPDCQGLGIGTALIMDICRRADRQLLVGTWAAVTWAIKFYERHGFRLVSEQDKARLLRTYWTVSDRQIETSVVLALPQLAAPRRAD